MFKKLSIFVMGILIYSISLPVYAQSSASSQESPQALTIQDDMEVAINYVLTVDGTVLDSSEGREPLRYVQGSGQIIPGLEREMAGLKVGDSRKITVSPEEGYGPFDPDAVVEVSRDQLPPEADPAIGMVLGARSPDGGTFQARIVKIDGDKITLDLNHPLAGKVLVFDVKVIAVNPKN